MQYLIIIYKLILLIYNRYNHRSNIIEKLGLYGDVNIGFRFFEMMAFVNTNVGVRYRIN